mgnify:FL=1
MSLKITFIGAGSLVFARTLFTDIMSVPELQRAEISFTDINPDNLEKTRELASEIWTQMEFQWLSKLQQIAEQH